jgi:integrase
MALIRLSKREVERLPAPDPSGRPTLYWADDKERRGLGILVSGVAPTKSWVCQAKLKTGKTRRITIGPVHVLTIEQAWEEARGKLAEIYKGGDPKVSARRRARAAATVREVLTAYLAASPNLAPKTVAMYESTAAAHLKPWLNRPIGSIDADAVETRFRAIADEVVERARAGAIRGGVNVDGRTTANAALRLFRALWNFQAERDPDLPRNPNWVLRRQWHRLDRRTRHVPADRLAEFYAAARRLPSEIQRDLVIFALFTGMRENEAAALRWSEVDLPQRMIRLPAGRMKAHKEFDLPMSDVVHHLLVARRAYGRDGDFVFPGNGKVGYCQSFTYALRQIEAMTGIRTSPHDLRRTFASVAATVEISPLALKLLVAHSAGGDVTAGYTFLPLPELRRAAQKVADRLKELCGIVPPEGVERLERTSTA